MSFVVLEVKQFYSSKRLLEPSVLSAKSGALFASNLLKSAGAMPYAI